MHVVIDITIKNRYLLVFVNVRLWFVIINYILKIQILESKYNFYFNWVQLFSKTM